MGAPTILLAAAAGALLLAAGCVKQKMYHWGDYDGALYRHYKNPQDRDAFVEALRVAILDAEQQGLRVPPGIYAEYGYALYEEGRTREAITYFVRERDLWPESGVLMEKMIRNAQLREAKVATPPALAPAAAEGAAGALEKLP